MPKLPHHLKRTTIITIATWFVVVTLFVLQRFVFKEADSHDAIVSIMVLLAIFLGLPTFLLCVIEWLTFISELFRIKHLSQAIRYVVIMGFVYLVGDFISFMIAYRVPYLGIKMVLFIHLVFVLWIGYLFGIGKLSVLTFKILAKQGLMLPKWLAVLLVIVIAWLVYQGIYFLLEKLSIFEYIFGADID